MYCEVLCCGCVDCWCALCCDVQGCLVLRGDGFVVAFVLYCGCCG